MSISKGIANGKTTRFGKMICTKCNKKIGEEDYLVVSHYVSKRGNEDDYDTVYHEACSSTDKTWLKYRDKIEADKAASIQELAESKLRAIELINNAEDIFFGEDEDGREIITILNNALRRRK